MKKVLLGFSQVFCFFVFYECLALAGNFINGLLTALVSEYTIFQFQAVLLVYETVTQTLVPVFVGMIVSFLLLKIFKNGLYMYSFVIITIIFVYSSVSNILATIGTFGLLSMQTGIVVWSTSWLGFFMLPPLFSSTGYTLKKEEF